MGAAENLDTRDPAVRGAGAATSSDEGRLDYRRQCSESIAALDDTDSEVAVKDPSSGLSRLCLSREQCILNTHSASEYIHQVKCS